MQGEYRGWSLIMKKFNHGNKLCQLKMANYLICFFMALSTGLSLNLINSLQQNHLHIYIGLVKSRLFGTKVVLSITAVLFVAMIISNIRTYGNLIKAKVETSTWHNWIILIALPTFSIIIGILLSMSLNYFETIGLGWK